jgi:hypothetical protein
MRCIAATIALFLMAAPLAADEHFELRVLYCGDPGTEREADFRSFLTPHFSKITLRDLRAFKEEDANGHDVVIFDWSHIGNGKGQPDFLKLLRLPERVLSVKYTRPSIVIGPAGGKISAFLKLKTKPLCNCLHGPAHHLALDHPLFHSPLDVSPKLEQMPTPDDYPYFTLDATLGPTMNVWKVQTKDFPAIDNGTVAELYGFNDSPDSEVIARGVSMKGPDTVALGRHANFFLWGFSAPPSQMTDAGQRLFLNVVCYMRQFDGQVPVARNECQAREWALRYAGWPRFASEDYRQRSIRQARHWLLRDKDAIPQKYKGNADAYLGASIPKVDIQPALKQFFPESLRNKFGTDAEKYIAYYKENLEYLIPEEERTLFAGVVRTSRFIVDEDAKAVGPSNRKVDLLERCVSKLERNDQPDVALRLLKRYTPEDFKTAGKWRTWLNGNRSRFFFSDVGGFKFFVAPVAH